MKNIGQTTERMDTSDNQLRPLLCHCGVITQADGSCVLNQGDSSVMAAVYGPTEVRHNRERLDRAYVDVLYKPKTGMPRCADKASEKLIRTTCEQTILTMLHPRTSVNIILQEMQNSGSLICCCINAACQALLDAAVPLRYTVAAVCCLVNEQGDVVLDPTLKQETEEAVVTALFVFDSRDQQVVACHTVGQLDQQQYQTCLLTCRQAAQEIFSFYRETMEKKLMS